MTRLPRVLLKWVCTSYLSKVSRARKIRVLGRKVSRAKIVFFRPATEKSQESQEILQPSFIPSRG